MIPDHLVEEVRARADIVEIVGEGVSLQKAGREWKGKCPFHDDKTPSFYVVPDKAFYTCFGCGESGDVFKYVMKRTGMPFLDAVRSLGARYGVEIPEDTPRDGRDDPNRGYFEANAFAKEWFRAQLVDDSVGARVRAYLEGRGISMETAERFGLGYAPDEWAGLKAAAAKHEIAEEILLELGLLSRSDRRPEPYDRFRDRLMFPIESVSGRVVGFGGRVLGKAGKGAPKYMNSPESPVYHKGDILYGLGWNRNTIRREGYALVVEGYMDVVALAAAGVENSVATLGTAMTPEHARLLGRYTRKALLLFDSDEAGQRATFRAADALLGHGIQPSVVTLPEGEDPDTVVRAEGSAGLRRYVDDAVDVLDRKLQLLDEKGFFSSGDRVRTAVDKLLPTLRSTLDPALRDIYVARVAERTGVRRETLEAEVEKAARDAAGRGPWAGHVSAAPSLGKASPPSAPRPSRFGAERQLLLILLRERAWVDRAVERIGAGEFRDPVYRAIFEALVSDPELEAPASDMPAEVASRLETLLGDPEDIEHAGQAFEDCLATLQDRQFEERQEELERSLRTAASDAEKRSVLEQLDTLRRTRRGRWNVVRREGPVGIGGDDQRMNG